MSLLGGGVIKFAVVGILMKVPVKCTYISSYADLQEFS